MQKRTETVFFNIASKEIVEKYRLDQNGQEHRAPACEGKGAVRRIRIQKQALAGAQRKGLVSDLIPHRALTDQYHLKVVVPVTADIAVLEMGKVVVGYGHGKRRGPVAAKLLQVLVDDDYAFFHKIKSPSLAAVSG